MNTAALRLSLLRVWPTGSEPPRRRCILRISFAPAGAGATNTDFVLFVSAVETANCAGMTVAYATACQRDQNDRPIFGSANFCPSSCVERASSNPGHASGVPCRAAAACSCSRPRLVASRLVSRLRSFSTATSDHASMVATATHEVLHALGFSSASWPLFRHADGTPQTPRESDGLPARVTATCHDGSSRRDTWR